MVEHKEGFYYLLGKKTQIDGENALGKQSRLLKDEASRNID